MRHPHALTLALALIAAPLAHASTPEEVLGQAWANAAPAERMVLLAIAQSDKTLESRVVTPAVEETVRLALAPGETPEARLQLLGRLRTEAQELLKARNEERKKAGGKPASFVEPAHDTQMAVALDYVAAAAGAAPSLEALRCLRLVREATSWVSHSSLVLALVSEGINRDEGYRAADLDGKLAVIRDLAVDRQMLSDQERKYLEQALVSEHLAARLAAGDSPADLSAKVKRWRDKGLVCFFTQSFADGMLKRLGEHRAARGGK
ncbi:MAG: hypothetical protein KIT58_23825 [Planctomycetota bacterium]|nr:hypothetical protein [Planctomycetota bacterium]